MNPKHLISGYAPETLAEDERRQLFAAALRDQEIFDQLASEERWRQLLRQGEVRRVLRTELARPEPRGFFAGLRRWVLGEPRPALPWALGTVAAALLAIVLLPRMREAGAPVALSPAVDVATRVDESPPPESPPPESPPPESPPPESPPESRPMGSSPTRGVAAGEAVVPVPESSVPAAPPESEPRLVPKSYVPGSGGAEAGPVSRGGTRSLTWPKSVGGDTVNLSYSLELNQRSGPRRVPADYRFQPRDQFRLRLEVDFTAWLYLFNRAAGEAEYAVLYPLTRQEQEPLTAGRGEVLLPEEVWLSMDDTPADEELVLVVASAPWPAFRTGRELVPAAELEVELERAESRFEAMSWRRSVLEERVGLEVVRGGEGLVVVVRFFGE